MNLLSHPWQSACTFQALTFCKCPHISSVRLLKESPLRLRSPAPAACSAPCLLPPPFHGGRDFEALAIFGDRAPRDVDIDGLQPGDDRIVRKNLRGAFLVDQLPDPEADRFRRMGITAIMRGDRGGEKIFEFEETTRRRHIFVGSDAGNG